MISFSNIPVKTNTVTNSSESSKELLKPSLDIPLWADALLSVPPVSKKTRIISRKPLGSTEIMPSTLPLTRPIRTGLPNPSPVGLSSSPGPTVLISGQRPSTVRNVPIKPERTTAPLNIRSAPRLKGF